ncbi:hypothetical protein [Pedobacter sp. Leaf216]|uniref:hypothetical protein n=1 Tax=Pedobacter sp. Leaf216 TaxID=1735684 RepID=UPI0012FA7183|nr:hypothetical protein [Pedobacter sp. Leaf216]
MRYLKILSIISFLLINGLGEHGIPTFAGIGLCMYQFVSDLLNYIHYKNIEISWSLGLVGISTIASILIILLSRRYKNRYPLLVSFIILCCTGVYMCGVLRHYDKIQPWFIYPFLVFVISSVILIIKNFKNLDASTLQKSP